MREVRFSDSTRGGEGRRVRSWTFAGFRGVIREIQSRRSYSTSRRPADSALSQLFRATRTFVTQHPRDAKERLLKHRDSVIRRLAVHRVESQVPERERRGKGARGKRTPSGSFWFLIRSEVRTKRDRGGSRESERESKQEGRSSTRSTTKERSELSLFLVLRGSIAPN